MPDWTPAHPFLPDAPPPPPPPARPIPWKPLIIPADPSRHGLLVGTAGWYFDDWAGRFYPPRSRRTAQGNLAVTGPGRDPGFLPAGGKSGLAGPRDWFAFYQLYFSFLELNDTFYREPVPGQFLELERRSKPGMRFSVKAHRDVSHKGTWDAAEGRASMLRHAEAVAPLVESGRFYSFLIQLDDRLERSRKALDFLLASGSAAVGRGCDVHVEFRHRTWHQEPVLQALKDAGIGICNTECPAPHAFPRRAYATTAKGYIRYCGLNAAAWAGSPGSAGDAAHGAGNGESRNPSPRERMRRVDARYDYRYSPAELATRVREQLQLLEKTGTAAVVFKNHARAQAPMNAAENADMAERILGGGAREAQR